MVHLQIITVLDNYVSNLHHDSQVTQPPLAPAPPSDLEGILAPRYCIAARVA